MLSSSVQSPDSISYIEQSAHLRVAFVGVSDIIILLMVVAGPTLWSVFCCIWLLCFKSAYNMSRSKKPTLHLYHLCQ